LKGARKISISDYINLARRDTLNPAIVKPGDLVKIFLKETECIGIVLTVDEDSMELQTPAGDIKWMSRYVIYEIIQ
jgi:hypothetical protein